jgi:hypothetical protein
MEFFKKIFRRRKQFKPQPKQLRIDGCKTELTAAPDDSELAAQALLESMTQIENGKRKTDNSKRRKNNSPSSIINSQLGDTPHDAEYYRELSEKIRTAHEHDARMAMRYVAYCEAQITSTVSHQPSDIATLERGLYQHQDAVEREGGDLLRRWQKCLALVIMKQYKTKTNTDLTDDADKHQSSDI